VEFLPSRIIIKEANEVALAEPVQGCLFQPLCSKVVRGSPPTNEVEVLLFTTATLFPTPALSLERDTVIFMLKVEPTMVNR
jgi:hypothetical protein